MSGDPQFVLTRDEFVGRTCGPGPVQQSIGATLHNVGPAALEDATVWFRSNLGPLRLSTSSQLAVGEKLRGSEFIADGPAPPDELFYATGRVDGELWRVNTTGDAFKVDEPTPAESLPMPDTLPDDVGETSYVFAWGQFRRANEITVDHVLPSSDYLERVEMQRAYIAQGLPTIARSNHFLFGEPGVLAAPGRFLYHYTKAKWLPSIAENGLRLAPFSTMNDPREARRWTANPPMTMGRGPGVPVDAEDQDAAARFAQEVDEERLRVLMVSFGRDRPAPVTDERSTPASWTQVVPRGYMQPRMWAQYGDSHQGVCIILDRHRLDEAAEALAESGYIRGSDVHYTNDLTDLAGTGVFYDPRQENSPREHLITHEQSHLFSKDPDWAGENEYRWICLPDDPDVDERFIPLPERGCVVGLVVGDQADETAWVKARDFNTAFSIPANTARCVWNNPKHFGAEVEPL